MKKLQFLALILLLLPLQTFAAFTVPFLASTTVGTIFAFPSPINGKAPSIMASSFYATSTTAMNVFPVMQVGTTTTGSLNGVIYVTGWPYVKTDIGINQAIDVCSALGPSQCDGIGLSGAYTASASIVLKSNIHLIGQSRDTTIITGNGNFMVLKTTPLGGTSKSTYSNISIENLTVKSSGTGVSSYLTSLKNIDGLVVRNSRFEHVTTPIASTPESLYIEYAQNVLVEGNYLFNLAGDGIQLNAVDHFVVANNNIASSTDDAIDIDLDFIDTVAVPSRFGTVSGNHINGVSGGNGIRVEDSDYIDVVGNEIVNISGTCILANTANLQMTGINISSNQVHDCHVNGISVEGNITGTNVSSNNVTSSAYNTGSNIRSGIQVNAASTTVTDNSIYDIFKTGGDGGGIVIFKKNDVTVNNNYIASTTNGVNLWNGSGSQTYTGIIMRDNTFSSVTTHYRNDSSVLGQTGVFYNDIVFDSTNSNPRFGIATTSPGSLFSIGSTINLGNSTTSLYTSGGLNLAGGCFAIQSSCLSLTNLSGTLGVGNGGTGATSFGQGWIYSDGTSALAASTSPTVNYIFATSTLATSTFAGPIFAAHNVGNTIGVGPFSGDATLYVYRTKGEGTPPTTSGTVAQFGSNSGSAFDSSISIISGTAGHATLGFGDKDADQVGQIQWNNSTNSFYVNGGNFGIATSAPGSLLSLNSIANFTAATSTFYSSGGINLTAGCFAIGGNCLTPTIVNDPFTHTPVYGQTTSATSTLLALTGSPFSLVASGTVNFVNASTTQLTHFGSTWFPAIKNAILSTNQDGLLVASTSIGWNLIKGSASSIFAFDNNGSPIATTSIGANYISGAIQNSQLAASSITISNGGGMTVSGSPVSLGGTLTVSANWPWTVTTNYAQSANSTTTAAWFQGTPFSLFASSTAVFVNATTTQFTDTGSTWFTATKNALLSTDQNGLLGATTSIGNSLLPNGGALTVNTTAPLGGGGSVALGSTLTLTCTTCITTAGQDPFTHTSYNSQTTSATSSTLWLTNTGFPSLAASSTFFTNASTTLFTNTGLSYLNGGLVSYASSTVGDGSTIGGLTVNGTATSTNMRITSVLGVGQNTSGSTGDVRATRIVSDTMTSLGNGFVTFSQAIVAPNISGATGAAGGLVVDSTRSATKGLIQIAPSGGFVSIGTTTAVSTFVVASSSAPQISLSDNSSANNIWTLRSISNSFYLATSTYSATSSVPAIAINPNSLVGIASSSPWRTLSVHGTLAVDALSAFATGDSAVCQRAGGEFTVDSGVSSCIVSSRAVKHDIQDSQFTDSLSRLMKLNPVSFNYNTTNKPDIGLIAEDVAVVDPRYAQYNETTGKPQAINWSAITADLVKVVQNQQDQINSIDRSKGVIRSVEENWQDILIGLLVLYVIYNEVSKRKRT